MSTVALLAAGAGLMAVVAFVLAAVVDCVWIATGRTSISKRCLVAGQRYPVIAVVISAVLALIMGLLLGHLFLGQSIQTACRCSAGATCRAKCPDPCACRPGVPAPIAAVPVTAVMLAIDAAQPVQPVPEPKPLLLAFKQRINPVCVKMKRELDKRPDVKKAVNAAYDVRVYDWVADKDQCDKYAVRDVPTCILVGGDGKEVKRFVGYKSPNEILRWLGLECPH